MGAILATVAAVGRLASARVERPEHLGSRETVMFGVIAVPVVLLLALPPATLGLLRRRAGGTTSTGIGTSARIVSGPDRPRRHRRGSLREVRGRRAPGPRGRAGHDGRVRHDRPGRHRPVPADAVRHHVLRRRRHDQLRHRGRRATGSVRERRLGARDRHASIRWVRTSWWTPRPWCRSRRRTIPTSRRRTGPSAQLAADTDQVESMAHLREPRPARDAVDRAIHRRSRRSPGIVTSSTLPQFEQIR